ncbi:MAG TPA: hypothetical protein PLJ27_14995 [Polyangiaceae bacterium]|jgi:hypothetical protein|nr:hypothetical protein [Polyangiaceae bacterium]HNZ25569.1 hypothetical protein [Polyangiaceae bacterium]HOD25717.1 hypothetical protein [Polyangiaceae bacterium]HOE51960.1 hypothetical protein [Polyangiaceae bacterium]HOH03822.1 hypothetical protein [Polyangiaceae bacterium]
MIHGLLANDKDAPRAIQRLVHLATRMPESTRALWATRFCHVYGELAGQRRVDIAEIQAWAGDAGAKYTTHDIIFGIQTYYVLVVDLLAVAALEKSPSRFLRDAASATHPDFIKLLRDISTGRALESRGVFGALAAFDFDWYVDVMGAKDTQALRALFGLIADRWPVMEGAFRALDPLSALYSSLLPRNLLHVLGEVHTPAWLAEMLVADSGWVPGQRLLDPFGGSGVFVLAALRQARRAGVSPFEVLPTLCAIDLNPIACAAARANIVLALARETQWPRHEVFLPILGGDALAPALVHQRSASQSPLPPQQVRVSVDGELQPVPVGDNARPDERVVCEAIARYGIQLPRWFAPAANGSAPTAFKEAAFRPSMKDRRFWEQLAILALHPADVVATNPPWVGWEYMARPYRAYLEPAWLTYGLFTAKGREASFLKEDLSTLALVTAWDRFLRDGGTSVTVLRSNTMTSSLAARGLRRLSLFPSSCPIRLEEVRVFDGLKVFPTAQVEAATWRIVKGSSTNFPVPVRVVGRATSRWQPDPTSYLEQVADHLSTREAVVERVVESEPGSRWIVGLADCVASVRVLTGVNSYVGRTGVFTGGANAVYYLRRDEAPGHGAAPFFTNVTERAKRNAPSVRIPIEADLVYEVVRGRDLDRWGTHPAALLLCPHTRATKMKALPPDEMRRRFPKAWDYLVSMRKILDERKGFTKWERGFREEAFYAIQRIGEYTFAPYKVAWRYIANDFIVAVVGPDAEGRPRLANDKVIFVGLEDASKAYYLCGLLSSDPIRWKVTAYASGTQISVSAIEPLKIPTFDPGNPLHRQVAQACEAGHVAVRSREYSRAAESLRAINAVFAKMFGISDKAMKSFRRELEARYPKEWGRVEVARGSKG